jgi:hypothetical protein
MAQNAVIGCSKEKSESMRSGSTGGLTQLVPLKVLQARLAVLCDFFETEALRDSSYFISVRLLTLDDHSISCYLPHSSSSRVEMGKSIPPNLV